MILVVIVCVLVWMRLSGSLNQKIIHLAVIGIVITGVTVVTAASLPIVEIPTGPNQELRVMPPTAFPLTMQQYRNYDTDQFYYRIVIGWPNGIPIFEGVSMDDQSEFIHLAHLSTGMLLGVYMLVELAAILVVTYIFERKRMNLRQSKSEVSS